MEEHNNDSSSMCMYVYSSILCVHDALIIRGRENGQTEFVRDALLKFFPCKALLNSPDKHSTVVAAASTRIKITF